MSNVLALFPEGVVPTREAMECLAAAEAAKGAPLTEAEIEACTGAPPAYPTTLPRFPDSNPEPRDG
jgi:hypothetical protein